MAIARPPLSNLGPMSEPWARFITDQTLTNAEAIERLGGDASNDGRINNSQMDLMSSQINELYQRQSGFVTTPNVSTPSFSSGVQTLTTTLIIPPPTDIARIGWLNVQLDFSQNNANQTEIYVAMAVDGSLFHRDSRSIPDSTVAPASWANSGAMAGYTAFTGTPGVNSIVTLTLQGEVAFSSGARTVTFQNIQGTYQYGQAA